ncbi:MAG TPA: A24 family peptidase [Acetobacteraceae bacterium]|nr:A24 family peptidase [Acetobacteraceae bacterium]
MLHNPPSLVSSILVLLSAAALLAASLHDVIGRTVPNWMAGILALSGLGLRAADGHLPGGIVAGVIVFAGAALCWRYRLMGGGDVKLLAATAIVVPPGAVPTFIAAVALAGGALALLYLAGRHRVGRPRTKRPHGLLARVLRVERWRIYRGGPLPYACAIAAGGLFVLL